MYLIKLFGPRVCSQRVRVSETPTPGIYYSLTVLYGSGQCTVLAGHATSSMFCHPSVHSQYVTQYVLQSKLESMIFRARVRVEDWSPKSSSTGFGVPQIKLRTPHPWFGQKQKNHIVVIINFFNTTVYFCGSI